MKTLTEVSTEVRSFGNLFGDRSRLIVPKYQREYRWTPGQVKTFVLDAISAVFDQSGARYYGSVTLSGEGDADVHQVVDGQQRITTAVLLLVVLRDLLQAAGHNQTAEELSRRLRTRIDTGEILHWRLVAQHPDANKVLEALIEGSKPGAESERVPGLNYVTAKATIQEVVQSRFKNPADLVGFADNFLKEAGVAVTTTNSANAVEIYIKQHETLSPLALLDKLKGRLYAHVPSKEQADFVDQFHKAQEIIWGMEGSPDQHLLHALRGLPITSDHVRPQDVLDEAVRQAQKYGVLTYTKDIFLPAVKALEAGFRGNHPSGVPCAPLGDIYNVLRLRRFAGVRPLFVAAKDLTDPERVKLFTALRNTLIVLFVAHSNPPANEKVFREWVKQVIDGNTQNAISLMKHHREGHAAAFSEHYSDLDLRGLGKSGVRLLLGVIENYGRSAMGETCPDAALNRFPAANFDVEHILPKDRASWSKGDYARFQDPETCVHRLGNLTMFESTRNRSIQDKQYTVKIEEYRNSNSVLTKSMHGSVAGTGKKNKAATGAVLFEQFPAWDRGAFDRRSAMLYRMLAAALDVSERKVLTTSSTTGTEPTTGTPNIPQARPENTLATFLLIGRGMTAEEDVAAHIAGRNNTGAAARQAAYCLYALDFMGLADADEGQYTLTDPGQDLFDTIKDLTDPDQLEALTKFYADSIRKSYVGGAELLKACAAHEDLRTDAVRKAARSVSPNLKESTLGHRCAALRSWFSPGENSSKDDDANQLL